MKQDANIYEIAGKKYPRMTRVIDIISKPEFYRWYAKNGYETCEGIKRDRAQFGTRCHQEFEHILHGEDTWFDNDEMKVTLQSFKDWSKRHDVRAKETELTLHNDMLGIAGTCDFIGTLNIDGTIAAMLLDWKTSKKIYETYKLQVAGYFYMYEHATGNFLDGAGIVAFRDGKIHEYYMYRSEIESLLPVLMAASIAYRWKFGYMFGQDIDPYNKLLELL